MSTSRTMRRKPGHHTRKHAVALLWLALLVPLTAHGAAPNREYIEKLVQNLSHKFPALTTDNISVSVQPSCPAEQVQLSAVRRNTFGGSTLTLRCAGSDALPFTAAVTSSLPKTPQTVNKVPLLRSGSKVRLEIKSHGFAVFTTATTLASGDIGDSITVRAARTNRILRAQVLDSSTVRALVAENQ